MSYLHSVTDFFYDGFGYIFWPVNYGLKTELWIVAYNTRVNFCNFCLLVSEIFYMNFGGDDDDGLLAQMRAALSSDENLYFLLIIFKHLAKFCKEVPLELLDQINKIVIPEKFDKFNAIIENLIKMKLYLFDHLIEDIDRHIGTFKSSEEINHMATPPMPPSTLYRCGAILGAGLLMVSGVYFGTYYGCLLAANLWNAASDATVNN